MYNAIFAEYLKSDQADDIETAIYENGFDTLNMTVKAGKALLKENGYPQKGWCVIVVDDDTLSFVSQKISNLNSVKIK